MGMQADATSMPPAWAAKGVHDGVLEAILCHVPPGSHVLDLGAGAGALSARMQEASYKVSAVDYMADSFQPTNIPVLKADLDCAEDVLRRLGPASREYIVASDVIEHLKYPWQFIELCYGLLREEKLLFLVTPNVICPSSRINVLINGWANGFGGGHGTMGHISPLFPSQLEDMLVTSGFEIVKVQSIGKSSLGRLREHSFRGVIQMCIALGLYPLMRRTLSGPCLLYVARKTGSRSRQKRRPLGTGKGTAYTVAAQTERIEV